MISIYVQYYELFMMLPNESVKETNTRFIEIVKNLKPLRRTYSNE